MQHAGGLLTLAYVNVGVCDGQSEEGRLCPETSDPPHERILQSKDVIINSGCHPCEWLAL